MTEQEILLLEAYILANPHHEISAIQDTLFKIIAEYKAKFQAERDEKKKRVKSIREGQQKARQDGKHIGRPRKGFDVARALQMRDSGLSYGKIAKSLGVDRQLVYRTLKDLENNTSSERKS